MKFGFTCVLIFFFLTGTSQDDDLTSYPRSIGIDAFFINNFIPLENTIGSAGQYLFHYRRFFKGDYFFKHGLDFGIFSNSESNESDINREDARFSVDYNLGIGRRKRVFNKGYVLSGVDWHFSYFRNQRKVPDFNDPNENSINTNLDQIYSVSFGPFLGFEYTISERISLYTEGGIYLNYRYGIDTFESDFRPERDFEDSTSTISNIFRFPRSIVLFYNF